MSVMLPVRPSPNAMKPALLDQGFVQRGASSQRVDRLGNRFRFTFTFPPMKPENASTFTTKLMRAKRTGLQINIPLRIPQGIPGAPVVDGAGQGGTSIALRGFAPGYIVREGFWFTLVEADGTAYLHSVFSTVVANGSGTATVQIEPPLRAPFPDGAVAHFGKPFMQGFMDGDVFEYDHPTDDFIVLAITVEEYR